MRFRDRRDAGRRLAERLVELTMDEPVVLALPRGGVPVAVEVAHRLGAPVDVFVALKIGMPGHEELGIGAVAEGWEGSVRSERAGLLGVGRAELGELTAAARREVRRRVQAYRGDRPLPGLSARDVIVVDDGLATGITAVAALRALRERQPGRLILAVPVCSPEGLGRAAEDADRVMCVLRPAVFRAVGPWYRDFRQISDDEIHRLLGQVRPSRS
jgi:putative phosphoribosyl transferase